MPSTEVKKVSLQMAKASMEEWEKVMDFVQELDEKVAPSHWSAARTTDEELGKWVRAYLPSMMRTVYGYRVLVDNCCDPNVDHLAFKPEISAALDAAKVKVEHPKEPSC